MGPNYYGNYPDFYSQQMQAQLNQQQQQLMQMQQQNQKTVFDCVQGEASADVFPVNNGQKVILYDVDSPYVYHKERDMTGKLTKRKFRLEEETEKELGMTDYVKAEEVLVMIADAIDKKLSEYKLTKKKVEEE